jgi:multidrug efflux system outer membrane protein
MRTPAATILALALGGCTMGPDYVAPEVDMPERWRVGFEEATDVTNTTWWEQFEDPVLDDLVLTALENNKDLRIATGRVEEFAARLGIARSEAFPQVGYDLFGGREQVSRDLTPDGVDRASDFYSATINVGWELDVWGRIKRASEAARSDLLAEEEARRAVLLTLVSTVATSYVDLRSLDAQLEVAIQTLETRAESVRLFEDKFEGGLISELEVAQIRSEYELAATRIPRIERSIALTENAISILLGLNPGPIPRGKTLDELILPVVPAGVPSDVLIRRPDIRAAEQDLVAANARIGEARAAFFPRITLTGLIGYASDDLSDLTTSSASIYNFGASVIGPIFTGGALTGQLRASEAVQRQTLWGYLQSIQTAFREVDDALVSNQKSREELAAQRRQVDALLEYAELARERWDNGYVSYIEVLDAERRLFDAELSLVASQGAVYTTLVDIYKSMGGGWVLEAEQIANAAEAAEREAAEAAAAAAAEQSPPGQ